MTESVDPDKWRSLAEIDSAALRHNAGVAARLAGGGPECIMAVVKANAYGHSLPIVTRGLRDSIGAFAVASLVEAREVERNLLFGVHPSGCQKQSNPDTLKGGHRTPPIYILSPALPAETADIAHHGFIPAISTMAEVRRFSAASQGKPLPVNVVVDTGMGRMGALPGQTRELLRAVRNAPGLVLDSVCSHFPCSDEDAEFTAGQEREFRRLTKSWLNEFGPFGTHIANSAGILHHPRLPGEMVRAGLMLYGLSPLTEHQHLLRPVMTWKTRVILTRDLPAGHGISYGRTFITPRPMTVASLAAGYGDGYPRQVSGKGAAVLVRGRRCAILGRVTMDQILIDVSALTPRPEPGEEAVLLGRQGHECVSAHELATLAGTIPWHVLTGITDRTGRRSLGD